MTTDQLGRALRDLVDGVEDDAAVPQSADLWHGGTRRRARVRAVSALAAASVVALVALVMWPVGTPRASVPATRLDVEGNARLTSFPDIIAKPPFVRSTDRPGVTAAVVRDGGDRIELHAVSPTGVVTRLDLAQSRPDSTLVSLSADGRWLSWGNELHDLVSGAVLPSAAARTSLERSRTPAEQASWWSADSRHAFVPGVNTGTPRSDGLVLGVDGSVTEAPLVAGGRVPTFAGWLDDDTMLAFIDMSDARGPRLEARTWSLGDPSWAVAEPDLTWDPTGFDAVPDQGALRLVLSPDRRRVLASMPVTAEGYTDDTQSFSFEIDASTGKTVTREEDPGVVAVPDFDTYLWSGWGCRPGSYRGQFLSAGTDTSPVTLETFTTPTEVSSRYDSPCLVLAGGELRGTAVPVTGPWWQDRAVAWGPWVAGALGLAVLLWRRRRGGLWREAPRADVPPLPLPTIR